MLLRHEDIIDPFTSELIEIDGVPVVVPILGVAFGETALKLHWWNSTVLTFANPQLNHVEYKVPEQPKKGIQFDPDMLGMFATMLYPSYFRPIADESTTEWYMSIQRGKLDIELEEL